MKKIKMLNAKGREVIKDVPDEVADHLIKACIATLVKPTRKKLETAVKKDFERR